MVIEIEIEIKHGGAAAGALNRIVTKREKDGITPLVEGKEETLQLF